MSTERDERIRVRAHELWEREGRPDGKEQDHWLEASRQIEAEESGATNNGKTAASGRGPAQPRGGVSSGLQPGGVTPGGAAGAGQGGIGTGGGSTAGKATGSVRKGRK